MDHGQATAVHAVPPAARQRSPEPLTTRSVEVQRRSLLCNGVLLFEDTGELLPDGQIIAPHRPTGTTGEHAVHGALPQRRLTTV
ncbi:DUF5999 family protein [Streptomyces mirabilis]|uniref:DUF5999 family protein n=1 Tax=Streptomyces mirabilis TaxID=68239 RepID=UPI00369C000A